MTVVMPNSAAFLDTCTLLCSGVCGCMWLHTEPGVVDVLGQCCTGPVDTTLGVCCPSGSGVDKEGTCCPGDNVDACGVCNGTGVAVDVQGTCCSSLLPPSGVCCPEGLDSCGVCGGDNTCKYVQSVLHLAAVHTPLLNVLFL